MRQQNGEEENNEQQPTYSPAANSSVIKAKRARLGAVILA